MFPERQAGQPYSYEAEAWSFGVIMYHLLYASYPFGEGKYSAKIDQGSLYYVPNKATRKVPDAALGCVSNLIKIDSNVVSQLLLIFIWKSQNWIINPVKLQNERK